MVNDNGRRIVLRGRAEFLKVAITQLLATNELLEQKDLGSFYGTPAEIYQQETMEFLPQITLDFSEDDEDIAPGYSRVAGEINFRIAGETNDTISEGNLKTIGHRIKEVFAENNGYVWRKGKIRCNYADKKLGYHLQILSRNKSVGQNLITKVLEIQGHTPHWKNLNISENQDEGNSYPIIPPEKPLLGKVRRLPRRRPIADVRFRRATAYVYGVADPIILYSLQKKYKNALVT